MMLILPVACGGKSHPPLAGEWVMMADGLSFPEACGSHGPITYSSDGSYSIFGEAGTWRLDGDKLTETMTGFDALHVDREAKDIGRPVVSSLQWVDRTSFVKRYADGRERAFRRCPETY